MKPFWSTTADLLRYVQWYMDESQPIVQLTHQPTWGDIRYYAMGLNWQMDDKAPIPRRIFQSGSTLGFSSYLVFQPELKRGVVLLTNVSDPGYAGAVISHSQRDVNRVRAMMMTTRSDLF